MRIAVYVVPIALAIYALFDLYRSDPHERAGLRPLLWVLIIVLLPVLGPIVWLFVAAARRMEARGPARGPASGPSRPSGPGPRRPTWPTRRPGPVAPDDDPDFLRELDRDLDQRPKGERDGDAGSPGTEPPKA